MTLSEAFQKYAADQKAFNASNKEAVDDLSDAVTGLTEDIKSLNQKIVDLQNSPDEVTPEDQARIDELQADGAALTTRLTALTAALKTLDQQTPPVAPVPSA
jgi:predicted  nucleic acid-binding Zn-ribbon protein